ncbi:hypothetical protein DQ04_03541040 [Trypanosoma grayi]|uniref:hypothetical protein n=1 Tax=Trypanosoma grayi TaxID=71804 RepID=UPI0004F425CC|nr:hypothetical protein DQ04_03541040 [Trypanosoma grayi]KEG10587.1 hypothetical protein DQ04_03541040 [Trypanosoma grayi]
MLFWGCLCGSRTPNEKLCPHARTPDVTSRNPLRLGTPTALGGGDIELCDYDGSTSSLFHTVGIDCRGAGAPDAATTLGDALSPQLIVTIFRLLEPADLLQFRAVCRAFNDVFLSFEVQQSLAVSSSRTALEPALGHDTLAGVIRGREAIVRRRELMWNQWARNYIRTRHSNTVAVGVLHRMKLEGKGLRVQLQWARESCRRAVEEWLGHQADCRRAQYNIRRNWFNVANFSCKVGCGVPPIILPDGTLCINDPPDTVILYVRRDRYMLPCLTRHNTTHPLSRSRETLQDVWSVLHKIRFSFPVSHTSYDPYMDVLNVTTVKGEGTTWRVHSGVVENLERRLEVGVEHEAPPPLRNPRMIDSSNGSYPCRVELLTHYSVAANVLSTFGVNSRDALGLQDCEWKEEEILAISNVQSSGHRDVTRSDSSDDGSHGWNRGHIFVVQHERDVTDSVMSMRGESDAQFTGKDMLELIKLQRGMASRCYNEDGGGENHDNTPVTFVDAQNDAPAPSGNVFQRNAGEATSVFVPGLERLLKTTATTTAATTVVDMRDAAAVEATAAQRVVERQVFGVFNERSTLVCASATTREVAVYVQSMYSCVTLGVCYARDVHRVRILTAPVFRLCDSTPFGNTDEGEVLVACATPKSVFICRQVLFRSFRQAERCVWDDDEDEEEGSENDGTRRNGSRASGGRQRHCTRYFLKGYYYHSPTVELVSLMEIGSVSIAPLLVPRPWMPQHVQALALWERGNADSSPQHKQPPHFSSWWYPLRDGHPHLRQPFLLYTSKGLPYIAFQREYTAEEHKVLALEDRPLFYEVGVLDGVPMLDFHVKTATLSPAHAFFVLGLSNGAILLLSPSIADSERCRGFPTDTMPPDTRRHQSHQLAHPQRSVTLDEEREEEEEEDERSDSAGNVAPQPPPRGNPNRDGIGNEESSNNVDDDDVEEEDNDDPSVFYVQPGEQRETASRLCRATLRRANIVRMQNRDKGRRCLYDFTSTQLFGNGFKEDTYIRKLQQGVSSVYVLFEPIVPWQGMPFHSVWILPPVLQDSQVQDTAHWAMHLDEWKLTTLNFSYEVVVYDLTLRPGKNGKGFVFPPLISLSPYKHHPLSCTLIPSKEGTWLCARIRNFHRSVAKWRSNGSEIVWHNGLLLVSSTSDGNRYSIIDFDTVFRDPDAKGAHNSEPVAYSATQKEYRADMSSVTLPNIPSKGNVMNVPRHYPLLFRRHFVFLFGLVMCPLIFLCASVGITLMMIRLDGYIGMPHWIPLLICSPLPLGILFKDVMGYDQYFLNGCGLPFFAHLLTDVLLFVVFPSLFVLKHDAYDMFHPAWVLLSIPLVVSFALMSVPSLYLAARQHETWLFQVNRSALLDHLVHFLFMCFFVLISFYFDGPSEKNEAEPKLNLIIVFLPFFLVLAIAVCKVIKSFRKMRNVAYLAFLLCWLVFASIPSSLFIMQFNSYYASLSHFSRTYPPSVVQSCFAIPFLFLLGAIYLAFPAFMVCRRM